MARSPGAARWEGRAGLEVMDTDIFGILWQQSAKKEIGWFRKRVQAGAGAWQTAAGGWAHPRVSSSEGETKS